MAGYAFGSNPPYELTDIDRAFRADHQDQSRRGRISSTFSRHISRQSPGAAPTKVRPRIQTLPNHVGMDRSL
jgi:hypothetical protein